MLIPGRLDLKAWRNQILRTPFVLTDADTGAAINYAGTYLGAQVRLYGKAPGDPLVSLSPTDTAQANGLFRTDEAGGAFDLVIIPSTLVAMPANSGQPWQVMRFAWDLRFQPIGGDMMTLLEGDFFLYSGVTQ